MYLKENQERAGVLDIGSNSIRLVVFRGNGVAPLPEFNEKALCGLGNEIQKTGKLSKIGRASAIENIARFAKIIEKMNLRQLHVIATAAVREAADGKQFVAELEKLFNFSVKILSGKEEAYFSALGVISTFAKSKGLVCDLGGGSLELVKIDNGRSHECASLPIGSLRFDEINEFSRSKILSLIDEQLDSVKWLQDVTPSSIYAIGGAWRSLARLHMEFANYDLKVIHGYSVKRAELESFLEQLYPITISTKLPDDRQWSPVSSNRAEQMPIASLILSKIMSKVNSRRVIFSAAGLREGYLFDRIDEKEKKLDPISAGLMHIFVPSCDETNYAKELENLICSFFPAISPKFARLIRVICQIRNIGRDEHPSYRAEQSYLRLLRHPTLGVTHKERVFIATAILNRYRGATIQAFDKRFSNIITSEEYKMASLIGLILDFGITFSGEITGILDRVQVRVDPGKILIRYPKDIATSKGQAVTKRTQILERAFNQKISFYGV